MGPRRAPLVKKDRQGREDCKFQKQGEWICMRHIQAVIKRELGKLHLMWRQRVRQRLPSPSLFPSGISWCIICAHCMHCRIVKCETLTHLDQIRLFLGLLSWVKRAENSWGWLSDCRALNSCPLVLFVDNRSSVAIRFLSLWRPGSAAFLLILSASLVSKHKDSICFGCCQVTILKQKWLKGNLYLLVISQGDRGRDSSLLEEFTRTSTARSGKCPGCRKWGAAGLFLFKSCASSYNVSRGWIRLFSCDVLACASWEPSYEYNVAR